MNFATIDVGYREMAVSFWLGGHLIEFIKFSLCEQKKYNQCHIVRELDKKLLELWPKFQRCRKVFVEGQYSKNIKAIRIESQLVMWFHVKAPDIEVKTFPAAKKYIWCDKKIYDTKLKRKRWAIEYVKNTLKDDMLVSFLSYEKKDDIADTIIMGLVLNLKNNNK